MFKPEQFLNKHSDNKIIDNLIKDYEMFNLPNKPKLTEKEIQIRAEELEKQYTMAVYNENKMAELESKIKTIIRASSNCYQTVQEILKEASKEVVTILANNLEFMPGKDRGKIARLLLEKAPKEVAVGLANNLEFVSGKDREEIARLLLEKAPKEVAYILANNLWFLLTENQKIARLLLEKAPKEAAAGLADNLEFLFVKDRGKIACLLLEKAPKEAAAGLADNLRFVPEEAQEEIARLLLEKAPKEAAAGLADNLVLLPKEIQKEIARLLLEKAPKEAAAGLANSLEFLLAENREEIARLLLEKVPQEVTSILIRMLRLLPEEVREEIQKKSIKEILPAIEKKKLIESEEKNQVLYRGIDDSKEKFLHKRFLKTGTETFLLGKTFMNNVILRIIPNSAFISWLNAYKATDIWKAVGFNYVPIEPIQKAYPCGDSKNVRVYAGVLGVNTTTYLGMQSTKKYHKDVKRQVRIIIKVLEEMQITHGHLHGGNFCVLHERTAEGEIDWNKPPRVYCIDFDQSTIM